MSIRTFLVWAFCIVAILFWFISAQAIGVISVDQAKIRVMTQPGAVKTGVITLDNPTSDPKHIKLYLEDWVYRSPDGSKEFSPAGTNSLSAASWINFVPGEVTIPAFGRQKINYTVSVPEEARGGHYAIMFFESAPNEPSPQESGVGVAVAIRVGCLFYVEPQGSIKRKAVLDDLRIEKKSTKELLRISMGFKNTGNVDITCGGTFDLLDQESVVYARGVFEEVYTLPGDSAELVATWNKKLPAGKYDLIMTFDLGKALEETNSGRGPVVTKEASVEIGENGEVIKVGELK